MRIAVVGSGISGLAAAHVLHDAHDVVVFEADRRIGGHVHTVDVEVAGRALAVDTGFIVFNDRTYPNFVRLLARLGIASRPTSMSFSVRCDRSGLEYCGSSLDGLFAQRRNLLRPAYHRMLRDILRFHRLADATLDPSREDETVGGFVARTGLGEWFAEKYLLPMGSAIWSCPTGTFADFPIRFVVEFYRNHGLLQLRDRPQWYVVEGGSRSYVEELVRPFRDRIRVGCPVVCVARLDTDGGLQDHVTVQAAGGEPERFDHVIFACHADQALRLLADPTPTERTVLSSFPYERNTAVLHTDRSVLPRRRRAWAAWNSRIPREPNSAATVTYLMNVLQGFDLDETVCTTLNDHGAIDPSRVLGRFVYEHPVFTMRRSAAQRRHGELLAANRTSFCGAYWRNGFHEDGLQSALRVCRALGARTEGWQIDSPADSTWAASAMCGTVPSLTTSGTACS